MRLRREGVLGAENSLHCKGRLQVMHHAGALEKGGYALVEY